MRKNFLLAAMKGEPAREAKWKFSMRGGLFAYFLPKQKVRKKISLFFLFFSTNFGEILFQTQGRQTNVNLHLR